ncbi:MAG: metallophosphoesterase [Methanobrevibacter sp.]|nr:metallophosphoesterase [Methanobrevibacter sp.]
MSNILRHTFIISDHHFGSFKLPILKTYSQKEENRLIKNWNDVIDKDDLVYYNGDFCDGNLDDLCNYFKRLNGQIILIKGNHDIFPDNVYQAIFKNVVNEVILKDLDLTIHHCPGKHKTKFEIYGHLHRDKDIIRHKKNSFCSCVQFNDGCPVSLEKVMMKLI